MPETVVFVTFQFAHVGHGFERCSFKNGGVAFDVVENLWLEDHEAAVDDTAVGDQRILHQ